VDVAAANLLIESRVEVARRILRNASWQSFA